jgi:hypothetical protein
VNKTTIAAMRLPLVAQRILVSAGPECRSVLAASPHTDTELLATLCRDKTPGTRRFAYLRTDDVDLLREELSRQTAGLCTQYAARNLLAPADLLVNTLGNAQTQTALGAYLNPATPEDARRRLTPARATELTDVGGSNHDRVVRAHELTVNNPWMLETPDVWDGNVRRALAGLPQATAEHLESIKKAGRSGGSAVRQHPALRAEFSERTPHEWETHELARIGGAAVDLMVLQRPDFDAEVAEIILGFGAKPESEPHIIGRILNRFGAEALSAAILPSMLRCSGTRYNAASWVAPVMGFLTFDMTLQWPGLREAFIRLGDDRPAWETFLSLIGGSWHGSPLEAAEASFTL